MHARSNPRRITERESSFRLHVWVPAGRARRRNDFQLTAARRRDLHLPVDASRRTNDALRLRELVAQRLGTATPDRRRIAFDIRRACHCLPGRRVRWLSERYISPRNDHERGDECDCGAQGLVLTFAHAFVNVEGLPDVPLRSPSRLGTYREYLQLRPNERTCSGGDVCLNKCPPPFRAAWQERDQQQWY
jgi:hypothetical protein